MTPAQFFLYIVAGLSGVAVGLAILFLILALVAKLIRK